MTRSSTSSPTTAARLTQLDPRWLGGEVWGYQVGRPSWCRPATRRRTWCRCRPPRRRWPRSPSGPLAQPRRCSTIVGPAATRSGRCGSMLAPHWAPAREIALGPAAPADRLDARRSPPTRWYAGPSAPTSTRSTRPASRCTPRRSASRRSSAAARTSTGPGSRSWSAKGWSFARIEDGRVVFKAEVAAASPYACQVQGVYVDPARRGEGLAAAGMAAVVAAGAARHRAGGVALRQRAQRRRPRGPTSGPGSSRPGPSPRSCSDAVGRPDRVAATPMNSHRPRDVTALAGIFATSGVVHLARPEVYEPIMPSFVPAHREVILRHRRARARCAPPACCTRAPGRWPAGPASRCCSASTRPTSRWPATPPQTAGTPLQAVAFGRLPLQLPMLRSAYKAARGR